MSEKTEKVGMASEYFVMSILYRMGLKPLLTLANNKSVDILIKKGEKYLTIDVKGSTGNNDPLINFDYLLVKNHYYIFLLYDKYFNESTTSPEAYIINSTKVQPFVKRNKNGKNIAVISRTILIEKAKKYKNNWKVFI